MDSPFQVTNTLAVRGSLTFRDTHPPGVRFCLCVNAPIPACLIPYPARYCMLVSPFWLKMPSRNEQLTIRLMPLLARCVPREHILHIVESLISGAYNPYSFCLVEVRHCHLAHLISFRMSDLKDISKRGMMLLLCIYPPSPLVPSASGAMNSMKASYWTRAEKSLISWV